MITSEQVNIALNVGQLSAENQRIYFKMLEGGLTKKEIECFQIVVAYFRLKNNPHREKALKLSMSEQLYEKFNENMEAEK